MQPKLYLDRQSCNDVGRRVHGRVRTLYAFDARRVVILLIDGDKTGDDTWCERYVPLADRLYDEHLAQSQSTE